MDNTRNFIDQIVKFWLINYIQTSSSIGNDLINRGFNMALGEIGKYLVFLRLSLMKIPEPLLNSIFLCSLAHYMKIRFCLFFYNFSNCTYFYISYNFATLKLKRCSLKLNQWDFHWMNQYSVGIHWKISDFCRFTGEISENVRRNKSVSIKWLIHPMIVSTD